MRLAPRESARSPISLVAMIDVLMIMLIFFMVTSTYLNLRMIPMARGTESPALAPPSPEATQGGGAQTPLLLRLAADGTVHYRGRPAAPDSLTAELAGRASSPEAQVVVLPSANAPTQALVSLLDAVTRAGIRRVRIVRLEALP